MEPLDELKTYLEMAKIVMESQGLHLPQLINIREDGKGELYCISEMNSSEHKDQIEQLIVNLVDKGSQSICFIAEAWSLPSEYFETLSHYSSICANPHRVEILLAIHTTKTTEIHAQAEIIRNGDEVTLGEWKFSNKKLKGRFSNFWKKARSKHYQEN